MDLLYKPGKINAGSADSFACPAVGTVLNQVSGMLCTMEKIGGDKSDGTDINVTQLMTSNHAVNRADIGAGPAPYAIENLGKIGICCDSASPVVKENNVHLPFSRRSKAALGRTGNPCDIGGKALTRGISGKHLYNGQGIL